MQLRDDPVKPANPANPGFEAEVSMHGLPGILEQRIKREATRRGAFQIVLALVSERKKTFIRDTERKNRLQKYFYVYLYT